MPETSGKDVTGSLKETGPSPQPRACEGEPQSASSAARLIQVTSPKGLQIISQQERRRPEQMLRLHYMGVLSFAARKVS